MGKFALVAFLNYTLWVVIAYAGGTYIHFNTDSLGEKLFYGILWGVLVVALASWPKLYKFLRLRYSAIVRIRYIVSNMKGSWRARENEPALREIGIIVYLWFFKKDDE